MFYNIFVCGDTTVRTEAQDIKTSVRGDGCGGPVHRPVSGVKDSLGRPGPSSFLTILDMGVSLLQLPTLLAVYMMDTYMVSTVQCS